MATPNQDYNQVRKSIASILKNDEYDDGSIGPVLVRLAWHSSGTYDAATGTGGSAGAGMRWVDKDTSEGLDSANAGLEHARLFLEPIKEKYPWISYSDLWTLAGVEAIKQMRGPDIPWKAGRTDHVDDSKSPPHGRLPDASKASDHLRDVFYRMGFNDQEIVALSGAHSLGRCHPERSGFDGPWVVSPTLFSNQYYKMMTKFKWEPKVWTGPFQYKNEDLGEELMMLPTDLALIEDDSFRPFVHAYAEDKELFFKDFSAAFAKLIELGVNRNDDYEVAPKKSGSAEAPQHIRAKL